MNDLRRFEPTRAPETLRAVVLARAREAVASSPAPSRVDRIFYSRTWRLVWAAGIGALLLVEALPMRHEPISPVVVREADAAAQMLGLAPGAWVGERVVAGDEGARALTESPP